MFAQIFASSACTGVVCTIGASNTPNSSATTSPERAPTPPTMHGSESISSRKRPAAIRSGACATYTSSPICKAAVLGQIARDELGRAGRHGRAQRERVPGFQRAEQVVQGGADVAHVDLDVREGGGAERDHDVLGAGGVDHPLGQRQAPARAHAVEQLLGAGLLEGHRARRAPIPAAPDRCRSRSRSGRGRQTTAPAAGRRVRGRSPRRRRWCLGLAWAAQRLSAPRRVIRRSVSRDCTL